MFPGAQKAVSGSPLPRFHAEMKAWQDLRERRIIQILGSYLVAGWVGLSVLDQLIGQGVLRRRATDRLGELTCTRANTNLCLLFSSFGRPNQRQEKA